MSALCEFATYVAEVRYRKFAPGSMGPLWADNGHRGNASGALMAQNGVLHRRKSAWSPYLPELQLQHFASAENLTYCERPIADLGHDTSVLRVQPTLRSLAATAKSDAWRIYSVRDFAVLGAGKSNGRFMQLEFAANLSPRVKRRLG